MQSNPRSRDFDLIGGIVGSRALSRAFHERVARDASLRSLFPNEMESLIEHFALYLAQEWAGIGDYRAIRGKTSLLCRHAHLSISQDLANRWLGHMTDALQQLGFDPSLISFFEPIAQSLLDPLIPWYGMNLSDLRKSALDEPWILHVTEMGHSLLKAAAVNGDVARVALLLELGADPNEFGRLGHGALYFVANSQFLGRERELLEVAELLIRHGAIVNQASGSGRNTPLHMAARRGNVSMASILLSSGANLEARDSKGVTPLGRARNCRQEAMIRFLLAAGALDDIGSNNGVKPL